MCPAFPRHGTMTAMLGAAIIVFVLVIAIPVGVMMGGALASVIIGWIVRNDVDFRHEGSELLDLNG